MAAVDSNRMIIRSGRLTLLGAAASLLAAACSSTTPPPSGDAGAA